MPVIQATRLPRLLGADLEVACADGSLRRYVNLDNAASTPVMEDVWAAVEAFVPWYSSVHRGSGAKSRVCTAAFEEARGTVAEFVGARADDEVVAPPGQHVGVVLGRAAEDPRARRQRRGQHVDRLGGVAHEHDLVVRAGADELRDRAACLL